MAKQDDRSSTLLVQCRLARRQSGTAHPYGSEGQTGTFKLLCDIGFKQIEIGFPSAAQTEI